jgi:hypothetical protein
MNRLSAEKRVQVVSDLLEGSSIDSIVRTTGAAKHTVPFSKKIKNHGHAVALHFMYYNFVRVHKTLRVTPAMEAGIADHVWSMEELVSLLDVKAITHAA